MYKKLLLSLTLITTATQLVATQPGVLDTTFNPLGSLPGTKSNIINLAGTSNRGNAIVIQPDGKIIVAGRTIDGGVQFALTRYNTDGSLDTTFSADGTVSTIVNGGTNCQAFAVALQPDGKIVVAGQTTVAGTTQFGIARFNANGSLDTTFNGTGTNSTRIDANGSICIARSIAIQTDGKIVLAGAAFFDIGGITRFGLARFNANGTLDSATFNPGGSRAGTKSTLVDGGTGASGNGVVLQADGKIIVAGEATVGSQRFGIARFETNGDLDITFNPAPATQPGTFSTSVDGGSSSTGRAVALQDDGLIVVAGQTTVGGVVRFGVARFDTEGALDITFNPAPATQPGTQSTIIDNAGTNNVGRSVAIQENQKIVIAGDATVSGIQQFAVARFDTNGSLDTTFHPSGFLPGTVVTRIESTGTSNQGNGVAIQSDGKIVVGGQTVVNTDGLFGVARFFGDTITPPVTTTNVCALRFIEKYGARVAPIV